MDTHKNARLTPKGREEMVRALLEGGLSKAAAARKFNTTPKTVAKWGQPLPQGRCLWFARPLVTTSFIASPTSPSHMRGGRGFAPTALHRHTDCPPARRLARNGEPHPAAAWAEQAQ